MAVLGRPGALLATSDGILDPVQAMSLEGFKPVARRASKLKVVDLRLASE